MVTLAVFAVGLLVCLSAADQRPVGHNNVIPEKAFQGTDGEALTFCQQHELLPGHTSALRLSLASDYGPRLGVRVTRGTRLLTSGKGAGGWSGTAITIPVREVGQTAADVTVCLRFAPGQDAQLLGSEVSVGPTKVAAYKLDDRPAGDRIRIDYLSSGQQSWWSYAGSVMHRIGLNSAVQGPWAALIAIVLMLVVATVAVSQLLGTRVPAAAWACALVACLNAATWAIVSPPFQFIDEPDHFAYTQRLAEMGRPPIPTSFDYSPEMSIALRDLRYITMRRDRSNGPIWSSVERQRLDRDLAADPSRRGAGAFTATGQPPLYYGLSVVPYRLASGAPILPRLLLMRLLSVLFAGVTGLFVFLFLREALPGASWAWTVGGLAAALQPQFGYASAAVNPDGLLVALSAALFYCIARALRRGLTARLSAVIGLILAVGFWTKLNFSGLLPGAIFALVAIALTQAPNGKLASLRLPAIALGAALVPTLLVGLLNVVAWDRPLLGAASAVSGIAGQSGEARSGGFLHELTFIWQLYFPNLPGMPETWSVPFPLKEWWLTNFVGSYGWLNVRFAPWVTNLAIAPVLIALGLCAWELLRRWGDLRRRALDIAVYSILAVGILGMIGAAEYASGVDHGALFVQARYLLPLLPLFAAVVALAARGAGRRWGPVVGGVIVIVVLAHAVFSQLLVVSNYYG